MSKQIVQVQDIHTLCQPGKLTIKNTDEFVYVLDNFNVHQTLCIRLPPMHIVKIEYPYMYVQCTDSKPFHTIDSCIRSSISSYQWNSLLKTIHHIECLVIRMDNHVISAFDKNDKRIDWTTCLSSFSEKYMEYVVLFQGYHRQGEVCTPCMHLIQVKTIDLPTPSIQIDESVNLFHVERTTL